MPRPGAVPEARHHGVGEVRKVLESKKLIGTKHGRLTAIERLPGSRVLCACDCGSERIAMVGHFNTGSIKSCGCHVVRHLNARPWKRTREYTSFHNMLARCHKPTNKRYKDYGAKGITVCSRWRDDFRNFLSDMGPCPDGFTIDRIDNTKGYFPENCRWVSRKDNSANRAISRKWVVNGVEFKTAQDAATYFGVSTNSIHAWCLGRTAAGRHYRPRINCYAKRLYAEDRAA